MTYLDPHASYRRAKEDTARVPADPHGIVQFTLTELERSLRVLAASTAENRALPEAHVTRALTAIYILQSSLDFEAGGAISDNLFTVYEYCRQQVLAAFRPENGTARLDLAAHQIAEIAGAWASIAPRAGQG